MTIKRKRFTLGVELSPADLTAEDLSREGELAYDSSDDRLKYRNASATKEVVDLDSTQSLQNKTIDATAATGNNTLSADSANIIYDDTSEAVISLGRDVQAALDAVKVALDNQNDANEISYDNSTSGLVATNVQAAIDEVEERLDTAESNISSNASGLSDHLADATDAHTASAITNVPSGNLAATDVQAALDELQSDIDTRVVDGGSFTSGSVITPDQLDVKQDTEANLETYALTASDGQFVFATDTQKMYQIIDNALAPVGGGGATNFELEQAAHGFAVGDGIYHNGTSFVKGQSNNANTLAYYVVVEVIDVNTFVAADFGRLEVPAHGFTIGQYYFLSDSVAGQPTTTEPSNGFSNPLFYVEDANTLQIKVYRPTQVGEDVTLDQLSDVSASAAVEGDIIKYDGANWQAQKQDEVVISLVAAETIAARDAIYVNASGQAALVDPDDDLKIEFIGFAREAANVAESVEIVIAGKLGGFSGLTAGELIYVDPTTPGAIVQPEPTQSNVYLIKAGKAVSATEILVNADLGASTLFNRDVVISNQTITNNQTTPANITGAVYDGASFRAVILEYSIYRKTDTNEVSQVGQLRLAYKTDAGTWSLSDDFSGDDAGVEFSVDGTGQILYTSSDLTGTNYTSKLQIDTRQLFEV